jgi:membrane-bound ClpP family serine protease
MVISGGVAVPLNLLQRRAPSESKKGGRDWGFLLFIGGILLVAIGTQVPYLSWIGLACLIIVVVGIIVRYVKQLYF